MKFIIFFTISRFQKYMNSVPMIYGVNGVMEDFRIPELVRS